MIFAHGDGPRLLVFAKAPVPGAAKTRLIPLLGAEGAARLQASLTRRAVATALAAGSGPVELWCAPDAAHPFFAALSAELGVALRSQQGSDLGERMLHADTPVSYPYAWYIRPLLFLLRRKSGLSEPVRLWGRVPAAFLGHLWMLRALERRSSPLDPCLRALIRTRISEIDVCAFCIDLNGSRALELGVAQDKLLAVADFADSALYDEAEKAALAFAEAVTVTGRQVDAAMMERLKRHYSDDDIVELAALIAHQNLSAKFNTALGVKARTAMHFRTATLPCKNIATFLRPSRCYGPAWA